LEELHLEEQQTCLLQQQWTDFSVDFVDLQVALEARAGCVMVARMALLTAGDSCKN